MEHLNVSPAVYNRLALEHMVARLRGEFGHMDMVTAYKCIQSLEMLRAVWFSFSPAERKRADAFYLSHPDSKPELV